MLMYDSVRTFSKRKKEGKLSGKAALVSGQRGNNTVAAVCFDDSFGQRSSLRISSPGSLPPRATKHPSPRMLTFSSLLNPLT